MLYNWRKVWWWYLAKWALAAYFLWVAFSGEWVALAPAALMLLVPWPKNARPLRWPWSRDKTASKATHTTNTR